MRLTVVGQEDKAGRFITAVAFYLTAASALLTIEPIRSFRYVFADGRVVPLASICLVVFLMCAALTTLHLVLALGPQLKPRRTPYIGQVSFLSFLSLSENPDSVWSGSVRKRDAAEIAEYQLEVYIHEAREAAKTAEYKYGRLVEARAFLFLGVAALALGVVFAVDAVLSARAPGLQRPWTESIAVPGAVTIAVITWIAGNDRRRLETDFDTLYDPHSVRNLFRLLTPLLALNAGFVYLASDGATVWIAAAGVSAATAFAASLWWRRSARLPVVGAAGAFHPMALVLLLVPAFGVFYVERGGPLLLLASFLSLVVFEGIRLIDSYFSEWQYGPITWAVRFARWTRLYAG